MTSKIVSPQSSILMVERSELITVCRQMGGMMEAGVDILRITRVLRAQTNNPRLLQLYDQLDHDLTMGRSLADAMERAPDVFSLFIVSLVQQGEARNDLAGAFLSIADYLQKEGELEAAEAEASAARAIEYSQGEAATLPVPITALPAGAALSNEQLQLLFERLQSEGVRIFNGAALLLLALGAVWGLAAIGLLPQRWTNVVLCAVAALFFAVAALRIKQTAAEPLSDGPYGHRGTNSANLQPAPADGTDSSTPDVIVATNSIQRPDARRNGSSTTRRAAPPVNTATTPAAEEDYE